MRFQGTGRKNFGTCSLPIDHTTRSHLQLISCGVSVFSGILCTSGANKVLIMSFKDVKSGFPNVHDSLSFAYQIFSGVTFLVTVSGIDFLKQRFLRWNFKQYGKC